MAQFTGEENQGTLRPSYEGNRPSYVFYSYIVLSVLNIALAITALIGNILIQVALHRESSLHPSSKLLYRCLAFSDLCVGLILQPMNAAYLVKLSAESKAADHTSPLFSSINGISLMLCGVSLSMMTTISVDRLLALSLMLRYRQVVTLRRVRAVVIFFWLAFIVTGFLSVWYGVFVLYYVVCGVTPLNIVVSTFSYTKIYATLRHHQAVQLQDHLHQGEANASIPMNIARYRKTVSTALCVYLALVACYLPHFIGILFVVRHGYSPPLYVARRFSFSLVLLNSSLNPILYCWKIRGVRQAVKKTIRQLGCWSNA